MNVFANIPRRTLIRWLVIAFSQIVFVLALAALVITAAFWLAFKQGVLGQ